MLFPVYAVQDPPPFRALIVQPTYDTVKQDRILGSLENASSGQLVEDALRRLGISDITVVKFGASDVSSPADATRDAIRYFLTKQTQAGGRLFVYFAGHGQQIPDDNGYPDEADGEDEAWVMPLGKEEDAHKYIRDDELTDWVEEASDKIGLGEGTARLMILSDSCHSGTMIDELVRDFERNTTAVPAVFGLRPDNLFDRGLVYIASSSSGALTKFTLIGDKRDESGGMYAGPLALALSDEVAESGQAHFGYAGELFEYLRSRTLVTGQHPILFGRRESPLFNRQTTLVSSEPPMIAIRHREDKTLLALNAGELDGIRIGMKVRLVPNTLQGAEPIEAQVIDTSLRAAFLKCDGTDLLATSYAVSLPQTESEVGFALTVSAPASLKGSLGRIPGIHLVPEHGRIIVQEVEGKFRVVHERLPIPKVGHRLIYDSLTGGQVERLIKHLWRWERLIAINRDSGGENVLKLSWVQAETLESQVEAVALQQNFVELFDEERLNLLIRPRGNSAKWYCYAFAIDADGGFEMLNSHSDRLSVFPEHALALRDRWTRLIDGLDKSRSWRDGDFIKVIASREPLDASMFEEAIALPAPRREPLEGVGQPEAGARLRPLDRGSDFATQTVEVVAVDGVRGSRRPNSQVRSLPSAGIGRRIR